MDYTLKFLGVVVSVFFSDIFWTLYFIDVSKKRALSSGVYSSIIILLGAYTAVSYIEDHSLVFAAAIGAFFGTSITVKYSKN